MKLSAPRAPIMLSPSDVPSSPKLAKISRREGAASASWKPVSVDELSPSWYQFGASYGLRTTDLLCLHAQVPWTMNASRRDALAERLSEMLEQREWTHCANLLAVLIRSELEPAILNDYDYHQLERLARAAKNSNRTDAPESAGMTARLGLVLLDQLHRVAMRLAATRMAPK